MTRGSPLHAAEPAVEASMRVSGTLSVDATGQTSGYTLDRADAYPPGIRDLVAQVVPGWRFEPVLRDGAPVAAQAAMHLLFVSRTRAAGSVAIALQSASFGEPGGGELQRAPWLTEAEFTMAGFDALPAGAFLEVGSGLKLLTPLNAG